LLPLLTFIWVLVILILFKDTSFIRLCNKYGFLPLVGAIPALLTVAVSFVYLEQPFRFRLKYYKRIEVSILSVLLFFLMILATFYYYLLITGLGIDS